MEEIIGSVSIISEGEQIAFVITNFGSYVVACIPDARSNDNSWQNNILVRANSISEAEAWYNKHYGLN